MRSPRLLAPVLLLAACSDGKGGSDACTAADALDSGVATATVDGAAWEAAVTWHQAGASLQVNTERADGWSLTLVAQTATDGTAVADAIAAGSFPIEVALSDGAGGWALAYPSDGDSYSTDFAAGGTLTIAGEEDDELTGCFEFTAAREGGASVEVGGGAVRAVPFE